MRYLTFCELSAVTRALASARHERFVFVSSNAQQQKESFTKTHTELTVLLRKEHDLGTLVACFQSFMSPRSMPVESASNDNDEKDVKKEDVPKEEGEQEDVSQNNAAAEPKKTKYENWPLRDIKEPHENDVLYGRGGGMCIG